MDKIQVILKEDVANLGSSGELVAVRPGYGRNYLIPQGLAIVATKKNISRLEHEKKIIEQKTAKQKKEWTDLAGKMSNVSVTIERQVGEENKLFGSVTVKDIEEALASKGVKVDRKKIHLAEPIKALGEYTVEVKLHREITSTVKVVVAAK